MLDYIDNKECVQLDAHTLMKLFHPCCLLSVKQRQMMLSSVVSVLERTQSFMRSKKNTNHVKDSIISTHIVRHAVYRVSYNFQLNIRTLAQ